jgi:membrane fusion protein, multidrug efflux system
MPSMIKTLVHALVAGLVIVGSVWIAVARGETTVPPAALVARREADPAAAPDRAPAIDAAAPWLGVVVPAQEVAVAAPIGARIEAVHARLGDVVERSQVLATLDRRQVEQDLAAARANLSALRARRTEAAVELEQARDADARASGLGALVPEQERTEARLQVHAAVARLERADGDVTEQRARIAKLEALRIDADVRAPFDGVVASRHVDPGAFVAEGATLLELVGVTQLVRLAAPGPHPEPGTRLRMRCDDRPDPLVVVIERRSPQIEVALGMVVAEARIELAAGQPAPALGIACEGTPFRAP